jgi:uncharacterized membrane protein
MLQVVKVFTVNRQVQDVYRFCRDFENAPRFMHHLSTVRVTSESRSHWVTKERDGAVVQWDVEIIEDDEGRCLRWQSVAGTEVPNGGSIQLLSTAGDTQVLVQLHYGPPVGNASGTLSKLFGRQPTQQILASLLALRTLLETHPATDSGDIGEAVRYRGGNHHTRSRPRRRTNRQTVS